MSGTVLTAMDSDDGSAAHDGSALKVAPSVRLAPARPTVAPTFLTPQEEEQKAAMAKEEAERNRLDAEKLKEQEKEKELANLVGSPREDDEVWKPEDHSDTEETSTPTASDDSVKKAAATFAERYEIVKKLGEGATAVVKLAKHKQSGERVAVKIVDKKSENWDNETIEAFQNEIKITAKLQYKYLVSMRDLMETDDEIYIVLELVSGGELFDKIIDAGFLPEPQTARYLKDILRGVRYLHDHKVAHRDMKPENILIAKSDYCKVSDFGASHEFTDENPTMDLFVGTIAYMAPEVIQAKDYTKSVDLWSVGVITYCMLSGITPFDGEDDAELQEAIINNDLEFFSPEWDEISWEAKGFVMRCLDPDPEKRITVKEALEHPWIAKHNPVAEKKKESGKKGKISVKPADSKKPHKRKQSSKDDE